MTNVHLDVLWYNRDGEEVPARGTMKWRPSRRLTADEGVVLPQWFKVSLPSTDPVAVEPTTVDWAWEVSEERLGGGTTSRFVAVPDVADVNYSELVEVDPETLDPVGPPPVDVWVQALEGAASEATAAAENARDEAIAAADPENLDPTVAALAADETTTTGTVLGAAFSPRNRAALPLPMRDTAVAARSGAPIPAEHFGGYTWGVSAGGVISRSTNSGLTWQVYTTVPGVEASSQDISRIIPTPDGEVVVISTQRVQRSTGWATGSPTWEVKVTNPTPSYFYPWGADGDGTRFVVVHYAGSGIATPDRADSRYGWISTDAGHTWQVAWDTLDLFGETVNAESHIHGAAYDRWEQRFLISEGHSTATGIYESRDDGATWQRIPYAAGLTPGNAPTTITPTDFGVVFGTDDPTNGVMVQPRGHSQIVRAFSRMGVSTTELLGYAHHAARDPRTGLVYQVWEVNSVAGAGLPAMISGSDGQVADQVWVDSDPARRLWRRVVVTDEGWLLAWEQSTDSIARGRVRGVGARPAHLADTGRVLGGRADGGRGTLAVGTEAVVTGNRGTAVGGFASCENLGVAAGYGATSVGSGHAIGYTAVADSAGTAVGYEARTVYGVAVGYRARSRHATATALGRGALAQVDDTTANPGATAVGASATVTTATGHGTAVGASASAGTRATATGSAAAAAGIDGTATGHQATASAQGAVAVGRAANAGHTDAVALGRNTTTTAASQVMVGPRDIEITDATRGVILRAPGGVRFRLTVADDGTVSATAL